MNNFVLYNFKKSFSFLFVLIISISDIFSYNESKINNYNIDHLKSGYKNFVVDKYNIVEIETFSLLDGEKKIIEKGINGISLNTKKEKIVIRDKVNEIIEVGIKKRGCYEGTITGYGPDCIGCSVNGNVYCNTREGKNHSLIFDGIYYNDIEFKNLRILAADHREFPCGTIIEFDNNNINDPILGIVLDTGYSMRKAYDNDKIHIDLAFNSETNLNQYFSTDRNTIFKVKRWGW